MESKTFMINKFLLTALFFYLLSCDTKKHRYLEKKINETKLIQETEDYPPVFHYGINLDSFSYISKKIKWGQSFSDIL